MNVFVTKMRDADLVLKASADVASGWRKNAKGNGAYGKGSIDYPGDRSMEISLNVRVRPHGRPEQFETFPEDLYSDGELVWATVTGGLYVVKNGKIATAIFAGLLGRDLEKREGETINFEKVVLLQAKRLRIQMNVSVSLRAAPAPPIGDIPEWHTQFFSGGLPSLGKRRP